MRQPIRLLSAELQNQIAAGEVVERPASVLKELVENALDAGATRIHIHIRDGGQSFIRVSDNGRGIPENELELALTRHATSKLSGVGDLQNIHSFGFRGEALPSIASVSRFRLASAREDGEGAVLEVAHGVTTRAAKTALPRGTDIEVSDLFSNVPARLKFLKQPGTEARKCAEIVIRMALAHLEAEFEFIQGDRTVHHFLAGETLARRLAAIWPESIVDNLRPVERREHGLRVSGLTGDPAAAQARPDRILIYVNQRPIQDRLILSAVREAYRGKILSKEYPQAVLFLSIPPDQVDVNVHPAKSEVRFQDEQSIFRLVRSAVLRALESGYTEYSGTRESPAASAPVSFPDIQANARETFAAYAPDHKFASSRNAQLLFPDPPEVRAEPQYSPAPPVRPEAADSPAPEPPGILHGPAPRPSAPERPLRYLGQFDRTYLILIEDGKLVLMDQHAAHERVLYHALSAQGTRGDRQPLLVPLELSLHPSQTAVLQDIWSDLLGLGFSLELSGTRRLLIQAVPTLLAPAAAREFLEDVLANKARSMHDLWAVMACKSAIKAGDALTPDEALALLDAWNLLPDKDFCPHGRPVTVRWSVPDLEKLFKRRG